MNSKSEKISAMFEAGCHYGYSKTRRHPTTAKYILGTKNKNDIIDLEASLSTLEKASNFIKKIGSENKQILFVGTKAEAKQIITDLSTKLEMPFVTERWIGGALTNFIEIKKRIAKLEELRSDKEKGELEKYTKKERLLIDEKISKMNKNFGGLVSMKRLPDAVIVIDAKKEIIAVEEAQKMNIPVVSLVNTDTDMRKVEFPIIGNDASTSSILFFANELLGAYREGQTLKPETN